LILLAFLLPFAIYLLALGLIHRRTHPLVVSGSWDFAGILFAASGFLLLGGPAVLTSLNERWRTNWLLGPDHSGWSAGDGTWVLGVLLSVLYFVLVVAGSAFLLWRHRHFTSIYNTEPWMIDKALAHAVERLGLQPIHSGRTYLFGVALTGPGGRPSARSEAVQGPHYLPPAGHAQTAGVTEPPRRAIGRTTILEVDPFPALRHVTLRWDPADSAVRRQVEEELARELAEMDMPYNPLGGWLVGLGVALLVVWIIGGIALFLLSLIVRN
jgi:hypothetical protein